MTPTFTTPYSKYHITHDQDLVQESSPSGAFSIYLPSEISLLLPQFWNSQCLLQVPGALAKAVTQDPARVSEVFAASASTATFFPHLTRLPHRLPQSSLSYLVLQNYSRLMAKQKTSNLSFPSSIINSKVIRSLFLPNNTRMLCTPVYGTRFCFKNEVILPVF